MTRLTKLGILSVMITFGVCSETLFKTPDKDLTGQLKEQFAPSNALRGLVVGPGSMELNRPILRAFTSDGCSLSPNSFMQVNFVECCYEHDLAYWIGGSSDDKANADTKFKTCMQEKLQTSYHKIISQGVAETYYSGVRLGGVSFLPNSFRWGYGWNYLRGDKSLEASEIKQAEVLYGKNLAKLKLQLQNGKLNYNLQLYTLDNSLFTILPSDKALYYYLRKYLSHPDLILLGKRKILDLNTEQYDVQLESCSEMVSFKLNIFELAKTQNEDQVFLQDEAIFGKIIMAVSDPGNCLK